MRIGSHEYANEADDDDVPKPGQSLGTPVPRQKAHALSSNFLLSIKGVYIVAHSC